MQKRLSFLGMEEKMGDDFMPLFPLRENKDGIAVKNVMFWLPFLAPSLFRRGGLG